MIVSVPLLILLRVPRPSMSPCSVTSPFCVSIVPPLRVMLVGAVTVVVVVGWSVPPSMINVGAVAAVPV